MLKEFIIPSPGESITEVEIAEWFVEDGAYVERNDELAEVESDKATLQLVAEESGKISIKAHSGQVVKVGSIAYTIDTSAKPSQSKENKTQSQEKQKEIPVDTNIDKEKQLVKENDVGKTDKNLEIKFQHTKITPVAAEIMKENNLNVDDIINGLQRITKAEVNAVLNTNEINQPEIQNPTEASREINRTPMSMLRRRLSERLVKVKNETAMLTTFNEVDMSTVMGLRKRMQNSFIEKYGFKLGFMGFFTKAVSIAAQLYPVVNAQIDGDEIVSPSYVDVGIAVQTPKGLMVPNIRNAESKSIPQIEQEIKKLAEKARNKRISIEELSGGTISITNGGVFGSLLSTPIINPPQSAILGMHNIVERPIAVNKQVVIRPMMYIALSYDHRIVDGKDSVGFLKTVKELIEQPEKMLNNGKDPAQVLLGL